MKVMESMKLIDVWASAGLARIGADGRSMDGADAVARRWGAALRNHPTKPAGILYRARHDPAKLAFAIFERPRNVFHATSRGSLFIAGPTQRKVVRGDSGSLQVWLNRPLSWFGRKDRNVDDSCYARLLIASEAIVMSGSDLVALRCLFTA